MKTSTFYLSKKTRKKRGKNQWKKKIYKFTWFFCRWRAHNFGCVFICSNIFVWDFSSIRFYFYRHCARRGGCHCRQRRWLTSKQDIDDGFFPTRCLSKSNSSEGKGWRGLDIESREEKPSDEWVKRRIFESVIKQPTGSIKQYARYGRTIEEDHFGWPNYEWSTFIEAK